MRTERKKKRNNNGHTELSSNQMNLFLEDNKPHIAWFVLTLNCVCFEARHVRVGQYERAVRYINNWDLHTQKLQSKFSIANQCKPIKCRVSPFPRVFFHVWAVRQVEVVIQASYTAQAIALRVWREQIVFIRISSIVNIESSCCINETERRWKRISIEESDSN